MRSLIWDWATAITRVSISLRFRPVNSFPKQKQWRKKALEIDPSLGEAHALLSILADAEWDLNEALKEGQLATNLSPGSARAYHLSAFILAKRGRFDEAFGRYQKGTRH